MDGNFDRDGKYLTHILVLGFKGCMHTCGRPDDQMWWVLGTTALLVVVQDVCAEWMKLPSIPSVSKLKMRALLEAWGLAKDFKLKLDGRGEGSVACEIANFAFDRW